MVRNTITFPAGHFPDGSVAFYIQKNSPGAHKESNWLPAPDGPIYLVMRVYWPIDCAVPVAIRPIPTLDQCREAARLHLCPQQFN